MIRIMIIASGDLWAGAEVMIYQLVTGLSKIPNLDILVVLLNKGRLLKELKKIGIEVHVVDESKHSFFVIVRAVRNLLVEFSPDVIHSHRYKENFLAWVAARGRKNIKLVATQHGMPEPAGKNFGLLTELRISFFFRLLSCCFDCTVLVSGEMQKLLVGSYGFASKDITVIHNGISIPKDISHRKGKRLVIGSAGRLFPVKDFLLFVDIAHLLVTQSDTVYFILAGEGPQHAILEEKIRSYGLQERFRLLGDLEDMDAFYRNLDVYINTSVHEGIPMSVLEAMGHGLPVVVPHVGGFSEIFADGECGYLVAERDVALFAKKILDLVDLEQRKKMGESARKRVEQLFSQNAMAEKYYQLYDKLLSREH